MSTQAQTPQAAAPTTFVMRKDGKIFSSRDYHYAMKQATDQGYKLINQPMQAVVAETPVSVKSWKDAVRNDITTPQGATVLGYQTLEQTRTLHVDMRSEGQKRANDTGNQMQYDRVLLAQDEVTELAIASIAPGTALPAEYYILEVVSFSPVYPGQFGVVTSGQLCKRYSTKFLMNTFNAPRENDVLVLSPAQAEAFKGGRAKLMDFIRAEQRELGLLTDADVEAAQNRDRNGKTIPENTEAVGKDLVDLSTGEVVGDAPKPTTRAPRERSTNPRNVAAINKTGFGAGSK